MARVLITWCDEVVVSWWLTLFVVVGCQGLDIPARVAKAATASSPAPIVTHAAADKPTVRVRRNAEREWTHLDE